MMMGVSPGRILSSAAAIVSVLDCVLVGIIAALLANLASDHAAVYVTAGVVAGGTAAVVAIGVVPYRTVTRALAAYQPRFPRP